MIYLRPGAESTKKAGEKRQGQAGLFGAEASLTMNELCHGSGC
jgi:hypothetical protein